ncbi:MAG: hypothetical protein LBB94_04080 [Clostridiales bacterium]|nr:hypothetical protein [Clostridiales bacterium]
MINILLDDGSDPNDITMGFILNDKYTNIYNPNPYTANSNPTNIIFRANESGYYKFYIVCNPDENMTILNFKLCVMRRYNPDNTAELQDANGLYDNRPNASLIMQQAGNRRFYLDNYSINSGNIVFYTIDDDKGIYFEKDEDIVISFDIECWKLNAHDHDITVGYFLEDKYTNIFSQGIPFLDDQASYFKIIEFKASQSGYYKFYSVGSSTENTEILNFDLVATLRNADTGEIQYYFDQERGVNRAADIDEIAQFKSNVYDIDAIHESYRNMPSSTLTMQQAGDKRFYLENYNVNGGEFIYYTTGDEKGLYLEKGESLAFSFAIDNLYDTFPASFEGITMGYLFDDKFTDLLTVCSNNASDAPKIAPRTVFTSPENTIIDIIESGYYKFYTVGHPSENTLVRYFKISDSYQTNENNDFQLLILN